MALGSEKRFQSYRDLVIKRKIGREGSREREQYVTALARYLVLRDDSTGTLGAIPSPLATGPRVDTSHRGGAEDRINSMLDARQAFADAKASISHMSHEAIIGLFVEGKDLHFVGHEISGRADTPGNRSVNGAYARAHIENGADLLARHFQRKRNIR